MATTENFPTVTTGTWNFTEESWNDTDWLSNSTSGPAQIVPFNTISSAYNYKLDPMYVAAKYINNYKLFFLCPLAIIANGLSLYVIKGRMRRQSSYLYMGFLAIFDTLVIFTKTLYLLFGMYRVSMSDASCKIMIFLNNHFLSYAVWILVAMTFERAFAVWKPLKMHVYCTVRRATVVLLVLAIIFAAQHSYFFDAAVAVMNPRTKVNVCTIKRSYLKFRAWYSWVDTTVYSFLPTIVIFVLNGVVITGMRKAFTRQMALTNNAKDAGKMTQHRQMTIMLLTISVTFFLLTTPHAIVLIYSFFWNYRANGKTFATYSLVRTLTFTLSDLNHCINFALYFVSGKQFRREFVRKFKCCTKVKDTTHSVGMQKTVVSTVKDAMSVATSVANNNNNTRV